MDNVTVDLSIQHYYIRSQASETDLNQHSRSSSQAQADKDDDSEDSGDDVVVISWGEGLNSKTTIKQQLLDIDDDGDVEQFGSKSVYGTLSHRLTFQVTKRGGWGGREREREMAPGGVPRPSRNERSMAPHQ